MAHPGKTIRIVLPFPAGGAGTDMMARVIGKKLSDEVGVPVVVDNKPGASTIIGAQDVAKSAPDGHTLFYTIVITHTQNPHPFAKLPYDPFKDFTALSQVARSATVLLDLPTLAEQGVQGVQGIDIVGWQGFFGPGGMNPEVAKKISSTLAKIVKTDEITALIKNQGNEPTATTGEEFAKIVRDDYERRGVVIKRTGIKLEQ